jgi:hypothetical protein
MKIFLGAAADARCFVGCEGKVFLSETKGRVVSSYIASSERLGACEHPQRWLRFS